MVGILSGLKLTDCLTNSLTHALTTLPIDKAPIIPRISIVLLSFCRIGHDNKGGFAGWYLDNIIIDAPSLGKKWVFPAGRWLDKGKDDGKIETELFPSEDKEENYIPRKILPVC